MIAKLRARYANGVLTPLEPLDLEEGREVMVSIEDAPQGANKPSANILEEMSRLAGSLIEKYPDDGRDQPSDGSINYKHYLYGYPKKEP